MSYNRNRNEEDRDESYGERPHQGHQQGEGYSRNDEGNVETGGYGRDAEGTYGRQGREGGNSSGGYNATARQNLQSHGFEERTSEYDRPETRRHGGSGRHEDLPQDDEEQRGSGRGGRSAIGSGETYVGLNRTGDDERRTSDAYGGESYSSNNQSHSYGSMNSTSNQTSGAGGTYVSGSGEKWKPGQTMVFQGAETETEKNPYAADAQELAGQTQGFAKDGVKQLGGWVETKAKEFLGK